MSSPSASLSEHLRFRATWNGVPVARAELTTALRPGRTSATVKLAGRAETNEALDLLWRMRDSFEATVSTNPPAPSGFVLRQHENGRRREASVTRASNGHTLVGSKQRLGRPPRTATIVLENDVHDPASFGYLIRMIGPELPNRRDYRVFIGTRTYEIAITPAGSAAVAVLGRSWPARKLRLSVRRQDSGGGATSPRLHEAHLWMSSGRERLPLRLKARTSWGWVVIDLVGRAFTSHEP